MLIRQLEEIVKYPSGWRVIIVDDGSPSPALDVVKMWLNAQDSWSVSPGSVFDTLALYRIDVDIPWNREGARNLASRECKTEWMVHVDIDHVLPAECATRLLQLHTNWDMRNFYRFLRFRVGQADATRRKDRIAPDAEFGEIHPHIDSYLCTKDQYWDAGGYNEDFSGILGGGSEFLRRLERAARASMAPFDVYLHVYTRTAIADASDLYCDRSMTEVKKLERKLREQGSPKPTTWLRFPWRRLL